MQKIIILFLVIILSILSCVEHNNKNSEKSESCTQQTIKDPNEVKPMARMMRTMAGYCDTMRLKINKNETVDSIDFPLMHFWTAEPTDSNVLEPLFFNNATLFEDAYRNLMQQKNNQKENYTTVINMCINCHNSYCSGPLRKIKKLPLDYIEK